MWRKASGDLETWHRSASKKPLIVLGARQVGKTFLVQDYGTRSFRRCHIFNFEAEADLKSVFQKNLDPERILKELSFRRGEAIDILSDLVFFDEIQEAPQALTSLKHFREKVPQLHLIAAGSLLGLHLAEGSFPVGHVDFLHLNPLSFEEFVRAAAPPMVYQTLREALTAGEGPPNLAHDVLWGLWREYLVTGGLPEVVGHFVKDRSAPLVRMQQVRETQKKIITAYLADFTKHCGKTNAMHIERVWQAVPTQLAAAQDLTTGRFKFKDVVPGVHTYSRLVNAIDWLNKAGLVIKVPVCHSAETPIAAFTKENMFKLYLFDVGILGCMLNLPPSSLMQFEFGTYKGYVAENYVAQELRCTAPSSTLYCWQENEAEIEFLQQGPNGAIPIEVKSATRIRSKSLKVFRQKYHPGESIIISGRPYSRRTDESTGQVLTNLPLYLTPLAAKEAF